MKIQKRKIFKGEERGAKSVGEKAPMSNRGARKRNSGKGKRMQLAPGKPHPFFIFMSDRHSRSLPSLPLVELAEPDV